MRKLNATLSTIPIGVLGIAATLLVASAASGALVSHWAFDDGSGATASDSTGTNNGTLGGNPTWSTGGKLGGALDFDGTDHVDTGAAILPDTGSFTAMGWLKTDVDHQNGAIFGQGLSSEPRLILYGTRMDSSDVARLFLGGQTVISTTKTNDYQWHHVALTRTGDDFRIFVDGTHEATGSRSTTVPASTNTILGRADNGANYGFSGLLDDMAIWDEALSVGEVGAVHALGNEAAFGYDVPQAQQVIDFYRAGGGGGLRLGDAYWSYQTGLNTTEQPLGQITQVGSSYVLPLGSDGTGVVAKDLSGHWAMNDGSGTTAADSSGTSDGTLHGDPTWQSGKLGGALEFDGSDWVDTNSIVLPATGDFTTSGWVQTSTPQNGALLGQGPSADPRLILYGTRTTSGDIARLYLQGQIAVSTTKTNDGDWHQVTLTRSGSQFKIYVDGVHEGSGSTSVGVPTDDPATDKTMIGACDNAANFHFNGLIDDVAIWNRTLSDAEVAALHNVADTAGLGYDAGKVQRLFDVYQAGSGSTSIDNLAWRPVAGLGGSAGDVIDQGGGNYAVVLDGSGNGVASRIGLIGHWNFDDGVGQSAADSAGGNNGRLGYNTASDSGDPNWSAGKVGGALDFDGGDYVDTEAIVIPGNSDFTTMGWIKADTSHNGAFLGQSRSAPGTYDRLIFYGMREQSDAGDKFNIARVYVGGQILVSDTSTNDDVWHHVALTRSGDTWRLYLDGVEEDSYVGGRTFDDSDPLSDSTIFGRADNGTGLGYNGLIDDIGIWNVALDGAEVTAVWGLADDDAYGYDLGQAQQLFDLYDAGNGSVQIGELIWEPAVGLVTDLGIPTRIGSDIFLRLDAAGGGVQAFIPEPATLCLLIVGLLPLLLRRKRRA